MQPFDGQRQQTALDAGVRQLKPVVYEHDISHVTIACTDKKVMRSIGSMISPPRCDTLLLRPEHSVLKT